MLALRPVKRVALNDLMHKRSQTVLLAAHFHHDFLNGWSIGESNGSSHGVRQQLLGQTCRDLIDVIDKQFFETSDIAKQLAIGSLSRSIHRPT